MANAVRAAERTRIHSIMKLHAPLDQLNYLAHKTDKSVGEVEDLLQRTRANLRKVAEADKALRDETVRLATAGNERAKGLRGPSTSGMSPAAQAILKAYEWSHGNGA
jgi:hypothetical protein